MNEIAQDTALGAPSPTPEKSPYPDNRPGRRASERGRRLTAKRARKIDRILRAGVIRRGC